MLVTQAYVDLVKKKRFNAIRIPCSWDQYMANRTTAALQHEIKRNQVFDNT
ncbi:cellulase family glycosylhydrolase [Pedobacter kyonggii]|uniref:Glycoside hydrolase family 5 domain-containing protein n=1 Tax=Pedobacter kyonggii TaxID=1926871 RepID=A0A4V2JGH1_9SPHI|nr:hypothetical protein EYS08_19015 [Pedobacter kyonggii]